MDPTVVKATQQFAMKLRASLPIAAFWEASGRLEADEGAQLLLAQLQERQQALVQKQQDGGDITQDEIDALRRAQREAQDDPVIMAYVQTQQHALAFLPQVNREISQLLGFDFGALAGAASC